MADFVIRVGTQQSAYIVGGELGHAFYSLFLLGVGKFPLFGFQLLHAQPFGSLLSAPFLHLAFLLMRVLLFQSAFLFPVGLAHCEYLFQDMRI